MFWWVSILPLLHSAVTGCLCELNACEQRAANAVVFWRKLHIGSGMGTVELWDNFRLWIRVIAEIIKRRE